MIFENKKQAVMFFTALAFFFGSFSQAKAQIPSDLNLDAVKTQLITYHDSGEYEADIQQVTQEAKQYLDARLSQPHPKPLAVVLDIDETSISNFNTMKNRDFSGLPQQIHNTYLACGQPAIKPTLEFYQYARRNKIAVFFISNRKEVYRVPTTRTLTEAGYRDWTGLFLRSSNDHHSSISDFKSKVRAKLEQKGYEIVVNMGDQKVDLEGGYAARSFKLPNPYYIAK